MNKSENVLNAFSKAAKEYFKKVSGDEPAITAPFAKTEENKVSEYTGLIGLTGEIRGYFYFTTDEEFLAEFTPLIMNDPTVNTAALTDLAGEIANQIAGRAQSHEIKFDISVPAVIRGLPNDLKLCCDNPVFCCTLTFRTKKATLIIGLN